MNTTVEIRGAAVGYESITVSSTALSFTSATAFPDGKTPRADLAVVTCETDAVRYRVDGVAPTASVGHKLAADGSLTVYGEANLKAIQFIRVTSDATLRVTYYRQGN